MFFVSVCPDICLRVLNKAHSQNNVNENRPTLSATKCIIGLAKGLSFLQMYKIYADIRVDLCGEGIQLIDSGMAENGNFQLIDSEIVIIFCNDFPSSLGKHQAWPPKIPLAFELAFKMSL